MLERLAVIVEHLVVLVGHPRVETFLLVHVDIAGVLEGGEVREVLHSFGPGQEEQDLLQAAVRTGGGSHPVVEQRAPGLGVVVCHKYSQVPLSS